MVKKTWAQESGPHDLDGIIINIYGPPGAGKTWAALTLSEYWPEDIAERTTDSNKIVLEDIIHVGFDSAALAGLVCHNVTVKYAYNFAAMIQELGFETATETLIDEVASILDEDKSIKGVIYDTITTADGYSLAHWEHPDVCPSTYRGGERVPDTRRMFGLHLAWHRAFQTASSQVPADTSIINLFHEKYLDDSGDNTAAAKARKIGDVSVNTVPATTGSAWQYYTASSSLELAIIKSTSKRGGKVIYDRKLYPYTYDGKRTKNRFEHLLQKPLDPNLKQLLNLIKGEK